MDQLMLYVRLERESIAAESSVQAFGTLAAIASAFGAKKAMQKFTKALEGKTRGPGSENMSTIRDRVRKRDGRPPRR